SLLYSLLSISSILLTKLLLAAHRSSKELLVYSHISFPIFILFNFQGSSQAACSSLRQLL
ncbi:hypothetical protein ACFHWD_19730, partial [Clostridium sp. MT-14]|uniref:hypothetical protein n=1 Tax=Clostridium sp. MT-14 TaxID=3348360 RepID=UPI0035F24523